MLVYDEHLKKFNDIKNCKRVAIQFLNGFLIFGYSSNINNIIMIFSKEGGYVPCDVILSKKYIFFSKNKGRYYFNFGYLNDVIKYHTTIKGFGDFPYSFVRNYEAIDSFRYFKGKQKLINRSHILNPISNYLKYTIGLEFETSCGYIPENICYRDGLIPLRDGSILGLEYSTTILKGNIGINFLRQQLKTLKEYTNFNEDCSLHIHFGRFPLNSDKIYNIYRLCKNLEWQFEEILPEFTFYGENYKVTGKNYCKKLYYANDFNDVYKFLVKSNFYGDFTQPHPNDLKRNAKWHVNTRYYWMNLVNLLCYNVNKTIEFRFIRPTYNFKKILLWIYIFNAILLCSENEDLSVINNITNLQQLFDIIYPEKLSLELKKGINLIKKETDLQASLDDYIGIHYEYDNIFNNLRI